MSEVKVDPSAKETVDTVFFLKPLLTEITLTTNRAIPEKISTIDLGEIGRVANTVLDETLGHENGEEMSREIYVTPEKKIFIRTVSWVGSRSENGLEVPFSLEIDVNPAIESLPRNLYPKRQNKYFVSQLHSHGTEDFPPSPSDLKGLFLNERDLYSQSLVFVVTPARKILIFRSKETPSWDKDFTIKKVELWTKMVSDNIKSKIYSSGIPARAIQTEINRTEQEKWLKAVVSKYALRTFACPSSENIVRIQDPSFDSFLKEGRL